MVARAFNHATVAVAVVQEVKLKDSKFAQRTGFGYMTHTPAAGSGNCRGIPLLARESDSFQIQKVKVRVVRFNVVLDLYLY